MRKTTNPPRLVRFGRNGSVEDPLTFRADDERPEPSTERESGDEEKTGENNNRRTDKG